jgi:hypothetical protein
LVAERSLVVISEKVEWENPQCQGEDSLRDSDFFRWAGALEKSVQIKTFSRASRCRLSHVSFSNLILGANSLKDG